MEDIIVYWCWIHNKISNFIATLIFYIPTTIDCFNISWRKITEIEQKTGQTLSYKQYVKVALKVRKLYLFGTTDNKIGRFTNRKQQLSDWLSPVRIEL